MRVVCCQTDIVWEDRAANLERLGRMLSDHRPPENSLLVLPEMFATGFSMNVECVAESPGGDAQRFLAATAREYGCFALGGVVTKDGLGKGLNEAVVYRPDGTEAARYQKMRPFCFGEADCYSAGTRTVQFGWLGARVSLFICYDLRFPELFRAAARNGTELFVVIASWPVARIDHWTTLLRARAIENQAFVVGVNRVGKDPTLRYNGRSLVAGPDGEVLLDCGEDDCLRTVELDMDGLREYRRKLPFLQDMHGSYVRQEDGEHRCDGTPVA